MKRISVFTLCFVLGFGFFAGMLHADVEQVLSRTGKVAAIDPEGQAIVVDVGSGKSELDVGAAIQPDTRLMVKGKSVPLSDLQNQVQVGDTVTLKYVKTDDLYAKQIIKR